MKKPLVYMFSGQGSQYYNMGLDFYQSHDGFRRHLDRLDQLVVEVCGLSVLQTIFDSNKTFADPLEDLTLSSLAIYIVERAVFELLAESGLRPDKLVAASMGIYAAACSAGCMDERDAIALAFRQGEVFDSHCGAGHMIAVIDDPALYYASSQLRGLADIAAVHFDSNFVLALPPQNLAAVENYLKDRQIAYQNMPVARAFHSRWSDAAGTAYLEGLASVTFKPPQIPLYCCSQKGLAAVEMSARNLWQAVRNPIEFRDTILQLEQQGPFTYVDLGPSGSMATFIKYLLPSESASDFKPLLTPFKNSLRNFQAIYRADNELVV